MYRVTAMICSAIITISSVMGAAFVPTLPYVPPLDVSIWGYIYNIFGVSALGDNIGTNTEKLEAYWQIYKDIVGASNQALISDMQNVLDKAKTERKISLSVTQLDILQQVLNRAINVGVGSTETEPITGNNITYSEIYEWALPASYTQFFTANDWTGFVNDANNTFGAGNWTICAFEGNYRSTQEPLYIYAYSKDLKLMPVYNGSFDGFNYSIALFPNGVPQTFRVYCREYDLRYHANFTRNRTYAFLTNTWTVKKWKNWGIETTSIGIGYQNSAVKTAIENGEDIPLTSNSVVENGVLDDTKPVEVDLPTTLPLPATDAADIQNVQEDLGVLPLPLTQDVAQTVADLKEQALAKYGDAGDYALDLTRYFPFCLPFDVARILQAFVAEPEAPSFTYTINNPFSEDSEDDIVLEIDLSVFDDVAAILRNLESILFVVGLAVVTRSLYLRG